MGDLVDDPYGTNVLKRWTDQITPHEWGTLLGGAHHDILKATFYWVSFCGQKSVGSFASEKQPVNGCLNVWKIKGWSFAQGKRLHRNRFDMD